MSRILKRIAAGVVIAGVAALLLAAGGYAAGARVNTTKSIPVGLYWTSSAPVEKGAYVLFCPPQLGVFDDAKERGYIGAGFCQGGYGYMMKRVLAAKDDTVLVADDGVRVNGELLPFSAPRTADAAGRPMPRFQSDRYTLGKRVHPLPVHRRVEDMLTPHKGWEGYRRGLTLAEGASPI